MSGLKKYKESPYFGGAYAAEAQTSDNKPYDGKKSNSKLARLGAQFSGIRLTRNPSKNDASSASWSTLFDHKTSNGSESETSNDGSKVHKIVSDLEKTLWSSRENKKTTHTSSIIMKEHPLHGNNDNHTLSQDKRIDTDDHYTSNGCSGLPTSPPKSLYSGLPNDMVARPYPTYNSLSLYDITSRSTRNSFPNVEDASVSAVSTHSKLLDTTKEEEYVVSSQDTTHVVSSEDFTESLSKKLELSSIPTDLWNLSMETHSLTNPFQHVEVRILGNEKMDAKQIHAFEGTSETHTAESLPVDAYNSLGYLFDNELKITSKENPESADMSWQASSGEETFSFDKITSSEKGKSDSMEVLPSKVVDGQEHFRSKDHYTLLKITGTHKDEKVFLSGVASSFYNGGSLALHGVLSCPSITKINEFLAERRDELHAGVPGKWLTIILGRESSELSTIVATIMYAYFLALVTIDEHICIIPVVNMARVDLALHPDVTWLFNSIGLNTAALLFVDEINLSYFHRFGGLQLILVNHTQLSPSQESLKDDVKEILAVHDEVGNAYDPHLKTVISDEDVGSSCTVITQSLAQHCPEMLAGRAICRLLLAGILLDTKNLTTNKTTRCDISMATLLLNGAGKFGRTGLFKILKQKSHDLSNMNTNELLRKQFKKLKFGFSGEDAAGKDSQRGPELEESVGMSSLPIPLSEVLAWEENSLSTIAEFPSSMGLSFFVLVTGYYETQQIFKREILLVAEDEQLIENISSFLLGNHEGVKFMTMLIPGIPSCMRGYSLDGKRISRSIIQNIIDDYFSG